MESKEMAGSVTVGVVNHNRRDALEKTLQALKNLHYPNFQVTVVDNHSTDGSFELVQQKFHEFQCIQLPKNEGPNVARNLILEAATSDYVLVMDNDIVLEPDALSRLMNVMCTVPNAAICHPEIRDQVDPDAAHHYNGGWIHYLGALVNRSYGERERPEWEAFDVLSGQALLIDRKIARKIGGFDNYYFFGWTDGDFTVRYSVAGYGCLNVPSAIGYHEAKPREVPKVFYQVRNRWYFMLKMYSWRTLFLAAPALMVYEIALMGLLLGKGAWKEYWRGNLAVVRDFRKILHARRAAQHLKSRRDREWLKAGGLFVPRTLTNKTVMLSFVRAFNGVLNAYWKIIQPLCR